MHGPEGSKHPNESVFQEIERPSRIVISHRSAPRYTLTITLSPDGDRTAVGWVQEFEKPEVAAQIRHIVEPANEQNLDRLTAVLSDAKP